MMSSPPSNGLMVVFIVLAFVQGFRVFNIAPRLLGLCSVVLIAPWILAAVTVSTFPFPQIRANFLPVAFLSFVLIEVLIRRDWKNSSITAGVLEHPVGFSVEVPPGWSARNTESRIELTRLDSKESEIMIYAGPADEGQSPSQTRTFVRNWMAKNHYEMESDRITTIGTRPAYEVIIRPNVSWGLTCRRVSICENRRQYILELNSKDHLSNGASFNACLQSFKISPNRN